MERSREAIVGDAGTPQALWVEKAHNSQSPSQFYRLAATAHWADALAPQ